MKELEIAEQLVKDFYEVKQQDEKDDELLQIGTNLNNLPYKNVDFDLIIKHLKELNFDAKIIEENKHKYLYYNPSEFTQYI